MDGALDIVARTTEAAFAIDGKCRVVAWNNGAKKLLGYEARSVLGKRCYQVTCGTDVFGNRFCDANCPVFNMARRDERVHRFELNVRTVTSKTIRTDIAVILFGQPRSKFTIMHLLKPLEREKEAEKLCGQIHVDGEVPGLPSLRSSTAIPLTRREVEVIRLLANGATTLQIANGLFLSVVTVRNHIQNILHKLKAHSRLEAVSIARRTGII